MQTADLSTTLRSGRDDKGKGDDSPEGPVGEVTKERSAVCQEMKMEKWTRREFVRGVAGMLALPHLPQHATTLAYLTCKNSIQVVQGERRTPIQEIACVAPACLVIARNTLYVANDVALFDRLPRGSVESFHIGADGRLTPLTRTALSLSAMHPRSMAVSPEENLLAVAAYDGGIYNLFAIAADGGLDRPCSILKDIHCCHPDTLTFDAAGKRLIAADASSHRQSVFAVDSATRKLKKEDPLCLL